ncbi:cation:proton antiporter [Lolliginicoccus suaedae]|uniref:cation:proton antiporter n=1 Tax=Lolliginicoccus suaedae TaxID=2605429 RepID=UPI0011EE7233|nr:cation:proton antiporter [Lolliginicoccus suaedae]
MTAILLIAALIVVFGLVSGRLRGSPVTAPIFFVAAGLAMGATGIGAIDEAADHEAIRVLAEATLVLVLFTDAARINLAVLRREYSLPLRLLGIGLPLMILLGTGAAMLLFDEFSLWQAALLAAVLAPTDAALGAAVVSDEEVPVRIRQTLNVESGLNDGIVLPVVLVLVALAGLSNEDATTSGTTTDWAQFAAAQVGWGVLAGIVIGASGGWMLQRASAAGWVTSTYQRLAVVGLAAATYAGAESLGGNGFIAAFMAGLAFGTVARRECRHVDDFASREGELLTIITFTVFAAVVAGDQLADVEWRAFALATASLLLVRPLAVAIALAGTGLRLESVLFLGWFGPRGLASILFALLVVEQAGVANSATILLIATTTVMLSVLAHGLSAAPWARAFGARASKLDAAAPEQKDMGEHYLPSRHRWSIHVPPRNNQH